MKCVVVGVFSSDRFRGRWQAVSRLRRRRRKWTRPESQVASAAIQLPSEHHWIPYFSKNKDMHFPLYCGPLKPDQPPAPPHPLNPALWNYLWLMQFSAWLQTRTRSAGHSHVLLTTGYWCARCRWLVIKKSEWVAHVTMNLKSLDIVTWRCWNQNLMSSFKYH